MLVEQNQTVGFFLEVSLLYFTSPLTLYHVILFLMAMDVGGRTENFGSYFLNVIFKNMGIRPSST